MGIINMFMHGLTLFMLIILTTAVPNYEDNKKELGSLVANIFDTTPAPLPSTPDHFNEVNSGHSNGDPRSDPNLAKTINQLFNKADNNDARNDPKVASAIGEIFNQPGNNAANDPKLTSTISQVFEPENSQCECVSYFQCKNGTIVNNGMDLIDIRIQGTCDSYLNTCCNPPDIKPNEELTKPKPIQGCGIRNEGGVGFRITGAKDNEAQFGEFPWMVAILRNEGNPPVNVYQCGGAIIHPSVILTAAHCVAGKNPQLLKIRAGEWDTQTKNEIFPHQDRQVESVVIHERFNPKALHNDFALLFLSEPLDLLENVATICLPELTDNFDGSRCFASGWGKDVFGKQGHYQVILKRVDVPMVPRDLCLNSLRQTRLGRYFKLDQSFVCAGGEGKDTCQGDGGSPLVCPLLNNPGKYAQVGIVAWGIGCGGATPGVYANVAGARPWIDQHMYQRNYDNKFYSYLANN